MAVEFENMFNNFNSNMRFRDIKQQLAMKRQITTRRVNQMSAVFQGKLAQNLEFGHLLEIGAVAESKGTWFSISLATGRFNERDIIDIGLHILIYLSEDLVVIKQQLNDDWLEVAKEEFTTEIFLRQFKVNLIMDEQRFHISVNSQPLMMVNYAVPISELNTIKLNGHLESIKQVDHRKYFPSPWPPIQLSEDRVNFSHDIPVALEPGHVMVIMVKLRGEKNGRFIMHFRNVWNCKRQEVHVSVRFDKRKIIRTSKLPTKKGKDPDKMEFGSEDTQGPFPFDDFSRPFKLAVAFTENSFKMATDGQFLFEYKLRTPNVLPDISGVKMFGVDGVSVRVSSIDHFKSDNTLCEGFEKFSDRKFK